jgi:hypothetical protein
LHNKNTKFTTKFEKQLKERGRGDALALHREPIRVFGFEYPIVEKNYKHYRAKVTTKQPKVIN